MTPQRQTLDQFNDSLRGSALWQDWMRAHGINLSGPIKLSDAQRKAFQRDLAAVGVQFDKGMEIDPAGNVNQNEGFGKQLKRWGPIVGGAALAAFGIPGVLPGLIGGGSGAASAGAAAGAAGAAGAGGAGAGLSFASLAPSLIATGGGLVGGYLQSRGASQAAEAQERAATEALTFEKQQYGDEQERLRPFRERENPRPASAGSFSFGGPAPAQSGALSFAQPQPQAPAAQMVLIQAPTGQQKRVPASELAHWESRGARRVG